jgi:hypothetical protein
MLKEISRDEASLVFKKLQEDGASVLCFGRLWGWRVIVRGTVAVSDDRNEIALVLGDGQGDLRFRLDEEDIVFFYSEPGRMPLPERNLVPEEARDCACVSIALPLRVRPAVLSVPPEELPAIPFREKLFFLEVREA